MPAIGSSSRMTLASPAIVIADFERTLLGIGEDAGLIVAAARQADALHHLFGALAHVARCRSTPRQKEYFWPSAQSTPQRMFSYTDSLGKMFVTWKLRDRPRRLIACGDWVVMSSPFRRIARTSAWKRPLMRLNSVDLPAPFGPMIACRSPAAMSSVTPRMICAGPKLLWTSFSESARHARPSLALRAAAPHASCTFGQTMRSPTMPTAKQQDARRPRARGCRCAPEDRKDRIRALRSAP